VTASDLRTRGYANAILSFADAEEKLDAIVDELFAFAKAVEQNVQLREALTDPALPAENKSAVIDELLGERADPYSANILRFLVQQGRGRDLAKIVEEFAGLAAERRQHVLAEVRTAVPLDEARRSGLERSLSAATGKTVEVKAVVDPSVVGGVVARVGDEVIDGSLRTRLQEVKNLLRSG
jgi:F-type H+-transporting ATPase subunit delta